jgi:NitT/TauT family transport system substrate-binding protein
MAKRWGLSLLAGTALALMAAGVQAQSLPVKLTLDWKFQGPTSFFLIAADKGYYKAEGLDVTIDSGQGSAGAVNRVVSGAYELGFADINALIEYNAANVGKEVKSVMVVYDYPPFGVYALKSSGIASPKDLAGKSLGAPVFDASYKLFPAFAKQVGIDNASVTRKNMDPSLREVMLIRKEVDFIAGHYFSSFLDLKAKGAKPEDIVVMRYSDAGMDFYGNGIIVSPKFAAENPAKVTGFIRATIRGIKDMIADPKAGIAATKKKDPLIDEALELERLSIAINTNIVTPDAKKNGIGGVDAERLKRSIAQVALAAGIAAPPAPDKVFDASFLPPAAERMLP